MFISWKIPGLFGILNQIVWYTTHKTGAVAEKLGQMGCSACLILTTYFVYVVLIVRIIIPFLLCIFQEVLIGIIGNLSWLASVRVQIGEKVYIISMLLELLSVTDSLLLLEVMKLVETCVRGLISAELKTRCCDEGIERYMFSQNKTNNCTEPEILMEWSNSKVSPFQFRVDEKVQECSSCGADVKRVGHIDIISGVKYVKLDELGELSQCLQLCTLDDDQPRHETNYVVLRETERKCIIHIMKTHVLKPYEADFENGSMSDSKHKQLELNRCKRKNDSVINSRLRYLEWRRCKRGYDSCSDDQYRLLQLYKYERKVGSMNDSKHKQLELDKRKRKKGSELDSLWLKELRDVKKWLPSIIFILGSYTNGKLKKFDLQVCTTDCLIYLLNSLTQYLAD
jgi:hypothetical protein